MNFLKILRTATGEYFWIYQTLDTKWKSCNSIYIKNLIKFLKCQRKIRKHCYNFFRQISLGWMNKPVEIILEKYLKLNSFSLQFKARTHHCVKVSVFGVFLVRIFPHLDWIRRDTPYLSLSINGSINCGPNCSVFVYEIHSKDFSEILQAYGVPCLNQIGVGQFL